MALGSPRRGEEKPLKTGKSALHVRSVLVLFVLVFAVMLSLAISVGIARAYRLAGIASAGREPQAIDNSEYSLSHSPAANPSGCIGQWSVVPSPGVIFSD